MKPPKPIKPLDEVQPSSQTLRATLSLRQMILQGAFKPGERIREIPLAALLGVSRIPLRLVLERLSHEGLLEIRPTRGFIVQQFSTADVYDAIELRGSIEGLAARLAAERVQNPAQLATLKELAEEMDMALREPGEAIESFARYVGLNDRFHVELLRLADSRILQRGMDHVSSLPFASPGAFVEQQQAGSAAREVLLIALEQHRAIIHAIEQGDGPRAEVMAREHARLALRNLAAALQNTELLERVPGSKLIKFQQAV